MLFTDRTESNHRYWTIDWNRMKCHRRLNELIETLLGNGICIMHSTEPHTVSNANPTSTECVTSPAKPSQQQKHSREWVSERSRKRKRERAARSNSPPHSLHHFTFDHFDHIADSHSIVLFDLFTFDCNRDMVSSMMPSPKCVYFVRPKKGISFNIVHFALSTHDRRKKYATTNFMKRLAKTRQFNINNVFSSILRCLTSKIFGIYVKWIFFYHLVFGVFFSTKSKQWYQFFFFGL